MLSGPIVCAFQCRHLLDLASEEREYTALAGWVVESPRACSHSCRDGCKLSPKLDSLRTRSLRRTECLHLATPPQPRKTVETKRKAKKGHVSSSKDASKRRFGRRERHKVSADFEVAPGASAPRQPLHLSRRASTALSLPSRDDGAVAGTPAGRRMGKREASRNEWSWGRR